MERESEEVYANENDNIEQYERRWEKYLRLEYKQYTPHII